MGLTPGAYKQDKLSDSHFVFFWVFLKGRVEEEGVEKLKRKNMKSIMFQIINVAGLTPVLVHANAINKHTLWWWSLHLIQREKGRWEGEGVEKVKGGT